RLDALTKARGIAFSLENALNGDRRLQPPERSLLVALFRHFRRLFDRTARWYCDEPERLYRAQERQGFWLLFACTETERGRLANETPPDSGKPGEQLRQEGVIRPPQFPFQR